MIAGRIDGSDALARVTSKFCDYVIHHRHKVVKCRVSKLVIRMHICGSVIVTTDRDHLVYPAEITRKREECHGAAGTFSDQNYRTPPCGFDSPGDSFVLVFV